MTTLEIREKIMTDDEFVLEEIKRLQYLYRLKLEIRNNLVRDKLDVTESVAEHIYGMYILKEYFMPLEARGCDESIIDKMILFHDSAEIEVGDIVTHYKTDEDRHREEIAIDIVIENSPEGLKDVISHNLKKYENQSTFEARFVKAIDKLEAVLQHYDDRMRPVFITLKFDQEALERTKERHLSEFPCMWRFYEIIKKRFAEEGFFYRTL